MSRLCQRIVKAPHGLLIASGTGSYAHPVEGQGRGQRCWVPARALADVLATTSKAVEMTPEQAALVIEAAQHHKLVPALLARQMSRPLFEKEAATRLRIVHRVTAWRADAARAQLVEAARAMTQRGIEVIVLKGIVCAEVLTPGQARRSGDHDLLVRRTDLDAANAVLAELGYEQRASEFMSIDEFRSNHHHDAPWYRHGGIVPFEVHHHPLAAQFQAAMAIEGLWERSVPFVLDGISLRRLSDVDQVLHLAVHSTEDGPPRYLREVSELSSWCARLSDAEWRAVEAAVAGRPLLARRVWAGLASAVATWGAPVPATTMLILARSGRLSVRRRQRWAALSVAVAIDGRPCRWEGWPARRSIEAATTPGAVLAAIAGAVDASWTSAGRTDSSSPDKRYTGRVAHFTRSMAGPLRPRRRSGGLVRFADIVGSVVLGIVTLPGLMVLAAVLALRSPGPCVFRQIRVGRNGLPFELLKLRTMPVDAEEHTGAVLSPPSDTRIVSGFAWVRRLHLDELPQLWNVLRGEMSLVGPRPERPEFTHDLRRRIPRYDERHLVRPGLTGLAQTTLGYHAAANAKLDHDLTWSEHPGLWPYLRIAFATPWSILSGPADRDADPDYDAVAAVIDLREPAHDDVTSSVA